MKSRSIFSIINEYSKNTPASLPCLLRDLNIQLVYANLEKNISGIIEHINNEYRIIVNENHPLTRQRFTIAHELGHYILHRDLIGDGIYDNKGYRCEYPNKYNNPNIGRYQETEANKFAVNLLMPMDKINEYKEKYNYLDKNSLVETMSDIFQVSKQSMAIRLKLEYP